MALLMLFLEKDYNPFDFAIGASAGVSNLVSYLSEQSGRNIDVICNLATSNCFFLVRLGF